MTVPMFHFYPPNVSLNLKLTWNRGIKSCRLCYTLFFPYIFFQVCVNFPIKFFPIKKNASSDWGAKHFLAPPLSDDQAQKLRRYSKLMVDIASLTVFCSPLTLRMNLTLSLLTSGHAAKHMCQVWSRYVKALLRTGFTLKVWSEYITTLPRYTLISCLKYAFTI